MCVCVKCVNVCECVFVCECVYVSAFMCVSLHSFLNLIIIVSQILSELLENIQSQKSLRMCFTIHSCSHKYMSFDVILWENDPATSHHLIYLSISKCCRYCKNYLFKSKNSPHLRRCNFFEGVAPAISEQKSGMSPSPTTSHHLIYLSISNRSRYGKKYFRKFTYIRGLTTATFECWSEAEYQPHTPPPLGWGYFLNNDQILQYWF